MRHAWWVVALTLSFAACNGDSKDDGPDADGDADTDADSDSDTDADTDTDPAVDEDGDGFAADVDCNDDDVQVYPGAPDLCGDEVVYDCDRESDDGLVTLDGTQGFDDLDDALAAAVADSEVLLCPGTYVGNFEATVPVRFTVFGDPGVATLDGDRTGTTLTVPGGTEIVGLTITEGATNSIGGGILVTTTGDVLLEDVIVRANRAHTGGGIGVGPDSVVTLVNSHLEDNIAQYVGGGASLGGGSSLVLDATSTVTGNRAAYSGAGVMLADASLVGGVISENALTDYVYLDYSNGVVTTADDLPFGGAGVGATGTSTITGTDISSNSATNDAGAAGLGTGSGEVTAHDVSIHDNTAYLGAGISVVNGTLRLTGTTEIFENSAYECGGGVLLRGTLIGGVVRQNHAALFGGGLVPAYDSVVEDVDIVGNEANEMGGGVFLIGDAVFRNTTIRDNQADLGAGVGSDRGYEGYEQNLVTFEGGSISGNQGVDGGGIFSSWPLSLDGTVIADNTALIGGAIYVDRERTVLNGASILRNQGTERGGGVYLAGGSGRLEATAVDLGTDADDNLPGDVNAGGTEIVGYGAASTFTCDQNGCTPLP